MTEPDGQHLLLLRLAAAERELALAHRRMARVLAMADAWDSTFGGGNIAVGAVTDQLRLVLRGD